MKNRELAEIVKTYLVENQEGLLECLNEFQEQISDYGWNGTVNFSNRLEPINSTLYLLKNLNYPIPTIRLAQAQFLHDQDFEQMELPMDINRVIEEAKHTFNYPLIVQSDCSKSFIECKITQAETL